MWFLFRKLSLSSWKVIPTDRKAVWKITVQRKGSRFWRKTPTWIRLLIFVITSKVRELLLKLRNTIRRQFHQRTLKGQARLSAITTIITCRHWESGTFSSSWLRRMRMVLFRWGKATIQVLYCHANPLPYRAVYKFWTMILRTRNQVSNKSLIVCWKISFDLTNNSRKITLLNPLRE